MKFMHAMLGSGALVALTMLPVPFAQLPLPCGVAAVQAAAPQEVAQLKTTYAALQSFRASFEQTLTHQESGKKEVRKGTLLFRKPLSIRWETSEGTQELLVVTPSEIWDYIPDEEIAYRYPPELVQDSRSIIQVLTGQAALDKDFDVTSEGRKGAFRVLHLYPKDPTPQMVEAQIYLDDKGYIQRADIVDFYGNHNDVRFTAFSANARVKDQDFRFTPPKGVEVEDRTQKKGVEERELFK
ncbi:outer-membrane lipoprotein carrier protein LolA [Desulfovibrio piger]|nr:outer-membrane lipoprotein carrier protein LolA [Desulfovibrio piger]